MAITIEDRISRANIRLKDFSVGFQIEMRGNRLSLRGTLPPKPDAVILTASRQRIPLFPLGILPTAAGIKSAEDEAKLISSQLARKEFFWDKYLSQRVQNPELVKEWVKSYEQDYFSRRDRNPKSETTWKKDYWAALKKLPSNKRLTAQLLVKTVLETKADTKTRQRCCMVYGRFAKFASMEVDLKPYRGSYSSSKAALPNVPSDEVIMEFRDSLDNPEWQWAFGMIAAYGLRPHEVFHLDLVDFPKIRVIAGKTGYREVYPLHPNWSEKWNLKDVKVPDCSGPTNEALGQRVRQYLKRNGFPYKTYDLRHAWAIRAITLGLDVSLAANQMGHSLDVHNKVYQRGLKSETHERAFEAIKQRQSKKNDG